MISFLDKSTHLFSLVPIWHLSACIKHFYTAIKIQFCIQLCENNCHIADCFSLCYFIFTIIFNDCGSLSIDLPSLPSPLLLDIRVFCLFFFLLVFYSYYEKTVFVARAGKMAHWVKVVVAKTDLWLMAWVRVPAPTWWKKKLTPTLFSHIHHATCVLNVVTNIFIYITSVLLILLCYITLMTWVVPGTHSGRKEPTPESLPLIYTHHTLWHELTCMNIHSRVYIYIIHTQ